MGAGATGWALQGGGRLGGGCQVLGVRLGAGIWREMCQVLHARGLGWVPGAGPGPSPDPAPAPSGVTGRQPVERAPADLPASPGLWRECPICRERFPPECDREALEEHVDGHFFFSAHDPFTFE